MIRQTLFATAIVTFIFAGLAAKTAHGEPNAHPPGSSYTMPHNYFGAHLLVNDGADGTRGDKHLRWARHLVGRWGHAKTLIADIDKNKRGPWQGWVDYINKCYELELIPFMRLGGQYRGDGWIKPEADAPGDYTSMAQAVKRVVEGFPRSDMCPLYIEIWNEPNLSVEWTGKPVVKEYADFCVQVSAAIRSIGDDRIKILNGGLALSPEWAHKLCEANPKFIDSFDVWSCHPYPMNRPPWFNLHDKTVPPDSELAIDSYVLEVQALAERGRKDVKVMITETGWTLGNSAYALGEGHPIVDEHNRADYAVRALRDFWPRWPEIVAVFPFEFCNQGWEAYDWVYRESGINPDGSPTKPHYQYTCVAALAKPTDTTGAINGTIKVVGLGVRLMGVEVTGAGQAFTTDSMGNFFLAKIEPDSYTVKINKPGFKSAKQRVEVVAGKDAIINLALEATTRGSITGTVLRGDTDKPLEGVTVTLMPGEIKATTNDHGMYRLDDQIPATYELKAELEGHYVYETTGVRVGANATTKHSFALGHRPEGLPTELMINNTSMEAGGGGGGKEWIALGFEPLLIDQKVMNVPPASISEAEAHTGQKSQCMKMLKPETVIRQITHYGTAKVGTRYTGGVWVKVDCPTGSAAWVSFDFTKDSGELVKRVGPARKLSGKMGWRWVRFHGVAPEGSRRLSLNLHTQGQAGVAYFDDAFVGEEKAN